MGEYRDWQEADDQWQREYFAAEEDCEAHTVDWRTLAKVREGQIKALHDWRIATAKDRNEWRDRALKAERDLSLMDHLLESEQDSSEHWRMSALRLGNGYAVMDKLKKIEAIAGKVSILSNPMPYIKAIGEILDVLHNKEKKKNG
jgi:hypothetical protein